MSLPLPSFGDVPIQPKAVALVRDGDRVLVERGYDRATGTHFHRAIGGAIEFGERAIDAVAREWREELGLALDNLTLLGVLENLFTYEGHPGHEVVFVFAGTLAETTVRDRDELTSLEPDGLRHEAVWVPLADLEGGAIPLYPSGILALLSSFEGSRNQSERRS